LPPRKESFEQEQWLDEIVSISEGAYLRKVSIESMRRLIKTGKLHAVELTERKRGITRREALRSIRPT
jgi:KaiC/GvpD/RAD55 family RecA-like ATPase